jgi:hypothetical protein
LLGTKLASFPLTRQEYGKCRPQKITSDTQRDAFKKHARLLISSIGHFYAESDARRTRIPMEGGHHSDDCGQPMIAA